MLVNRGIKKQTWPPSRESGPTQIRQIRRQMKTITQISAGGKTTRVFSSGCVSERNTNCQRDVKRRILHSVETNGGTNVSVNASVRSASCNHVDALQIMWTGN